MREVGAPGVTRALIGAAALLQAVSTARILSGVIDPATMRTPFFDWVPLLTQSTLPAYIGAWCLAAIAFTVGWRVRLSGSLLVVVMGYALIVDEQSYSNHVYLIAIAVLLLMLPDDIARRYLRLQLSATYFFGSVSKVNLIYISGVLIASNLQEGWLLPFPDSLVRWELMLPLAMLSIMLDLFLAFAFWLPRYRMIGLAVGIVFHVAIVLTFPAGSVIGLIVFALTMFALYCTFVDPVAVWARLRDRAGQFRQQPEWRPVRGG